jgi:hypothetical protein
MVHAASAAVSLLIASGIGLALLVVPQSPRSLHAAAAYGVFGLIGFLAQMVVAMEGRLLPMVTWFWMYEASDFKVPPPPPHAMRDAALQMIVLGGWIIGVPALAAGMYLESAGWVSIGAWTLLAAVAIGSLDNALVVSRSVQRNGSTAKHAA